MANPFVRVKSFTASTAGDGALFVDLTVFDATGTEVPGLETTMMVPGEALQAIVSELPDQPTLQDAYDMILRVASRIDQRYGWQALWERMAQNEAAKAAEVALTNILAQFELPSTNIDVPLEG